MTVGLNAFLLVAGLLFAIGFFGVLLRRNTLIIYMSLELMLTAIGLALVAFSRFNGIIDGLIFYFFIITVAAAEVAVGLAIIVQLYRRRQSVMVEDLSSLRD
ncbi:MAG: NADH-quinone oxidoreductase subunit NuoK [Verrucomicrobiota bacterium]